MNGNILKGNRSRLGRESFQINKKSKGFTLVELIVVLVIVAILAAIAVPVMIGFIDRANEKKIISEAEASLTATQTVLNEAYNGGVGCISMESRDRARDMASNSMPDEKQYGKDEFATMTAFKIWTVNTWSENKEVKATDDFIGYYTVNYALFTYFDKSVAFYNGAEWNVYDSETKAKEKDNIFKSLTDDPVVIWVHGSRDVASDPSNPSVNPIVWDETIITGDYQVILASGQANIGGQNVNKISFPGNVPSVNFPYDESTVDTFVNSYVSDIKITKFFDANTLKWHYSTNTGVQGDVATTSEMIEMIKNYSSGTIKTITFTAEPDPKTIEVAVSVSPVNGNTLLVNGSENGFSENGKYLLTGEFSSDSADFLSKFENVNVSPVADAVSKSGGISFDGKYRLGDVTYYEIKPVINKAINDTITSFVNDSSENPQLGDVNLQFEVAANVTKLVTLQGTDEADIKFDGENKKNTYTYSFTKNEKEDAIYTGATIDANNILCDSIENISNEKANELFGKAGISYTGKGRPNNWKVYDKSYTKIAGSDRYSKANLSGIRSEEWANPIKTSLKQLYTQEDNFHELAEVELSNANVMLDYTDRDLGEKSPVWSYLYWLAGGASIEAGKKLTITTNSGCQNYVQNMTEIRFISLNDYKNLGNKEKEVCLSSMTTNLVRNGNLLASGSDSGFVVSGKRDEEYPCFAVACKRSGDNVIYVATEDDADMMTQKSLESMFADFKIATSNSMIEHMDISGATSTKTMFKDNQSLTSYNALCNLDTRSSQDLSYMFKNCMTMENTKENPMYAHIDSAASVQGMFSGCNLLKAFIFEGGSNKNCPLGNQYADNVFAQTAITSLEVKNLVFENFEETGKGEGDNITERTNKQIGNKDATTTGKINNGLYKFMESAVKANDGSKRTLEKVVFTNVTCPKLQTTRNLFSPDNANFPTSLVYVDLSGLSVPKNTSIRRMFYYCDALTGTCEGDNYLNISGVVRQEPEKDGYMNMSTVFSHCTNLQTTDIQGLDTTKGWCIDWMFEYCENLQEATVNIKNTEGMGSLFLHCSNIKSITLKAGEGEERGVCYLEDGEDNLGKDKIICECPKLETFNLQNVDFKKKNEDSKNVTNLIIFFENMTKTKLKNVTINHVSGNDITSLNSLLKGASNLESATVNIVKNQNDPTDLPITDLTSTFDGCSKLATLDWNVETKSVTSFKNTFNNCQKLPYSVENPIEIHVNSALDMTSMFANCKEVKGVVITTEHDGTGSATCSIPDGNTAGIFSGAGIEKLVIKEVVFDQFKTAGDNASGLHNMIRTAGATAKEIDLIDVGLPELQTMSCLFTPKFGPSAGDGFKNLKTVQMKNVSGNKITSLKSMLYGASNLESATINIIKGSGASPITDLTSTFNGCSKLATLEWNVETKDVKSFNSTFYNCQQLPYSAENPIVINVNSATDMRYMFTNCKAVKGVEITTKHDGAVSATCSIQNDNTKDIFNGSGIEKLVIKDAVFDQFKADQNAASGLHYIIRSAGKTASEIDLIDVGLPYLKSMAFLFTSKENAGVNDGFKNLETVRIEGVNAPNLYRFKGLMCYNNKLQEVHFKDFTISTITNVNFSWVFMGCTNLKTIDFGNFTATKATDLNDLFGGCESLEEIYIPFDCPNNPSVEGLFAGCKNLGTIKVNEGFNLTRASKDADPSQWNKNLKGMFAGCTSLQGGKGTTYDAGSVGKARAKIDGGPGNEGYFTKYESE